LLLRKPEASPYATTPPFLEAFLFDLKSSPGNSRFGGFRVRTGKPARLHFLTTQGPSPLRVSLTGQENNRKKQEAKPKKHKKQQQKHKKQHEKRKKQQEKHKKQQKKPTHP
jgi:hypothetical protein